MEKYYAALGQENTIGHLDLWFRMGEFGNIRLQSCKKIGSGLGFANTVSKHEYACSLLCKIGHISIHYTMIVLCPLRSTKKGGYL